MEMDDTDMEALVLEESPAEDEQEGEHEQIGTDNDGKTETEVLENIEIIIQNDGEFLLRVTEICVKYII